MMTPTERTANHFKGKVAIVTGGASGIGQAVCGALCRCGAQVVVADIDLARAQQVATELSVNGVKARGAHVDVAKAELVQKLVADTAAEYGRVDYMFNNAAATATRGEIRDLTLDPWHRAVDVKLLGVVYGTTAAYALMRKQGFGHIVNTGSLAGLVGFPTSIPYGATKSAVVNLTTALRVEAKEENIKVSVVCPGPVHEDGKNPKLIGVERAAQLILAGVARNNAIIVFPLSARFIWWVNRLSPSLMILIGGKYVRGFRRRRLARAEAAMASQK